MCILNLLTDSFMKMEQFFCALNMRLIKCQAVNINNGFFFINYTCNTSYIPTSHALTAAYLYLHVIC